MHITYHGVRVILDGNSDLGWRPDWTRPWTIHDARALVEHWGEDLAAEWPRDEDFVIRDGATLPKAVCRYLAEEGCMHEEDIEQLLRESKHADIEDAETFNAELRRELQGETE
jgi:hypothetical protein